MLSNAAPHAATRPLRRLIKGLARRPLVDGAGRIELDRQLLDTLIELRPMLRTEASSHAGAPPRPVGLAMAAAIFGQPLLRVLERLQSASTTDVTWLAGPASDAPVVFDSEVLARQLGLRGLELDDLREDIDRRLAGLLKQVRALWWLWQHFGLPQTGNDELFAALFPGKSDAQARRGMIALGPQLYAISASSQPPPPEALYLSWLPVDADRALHPSRAFRSRDVDPTLRQALSRSIGATPNEVNAMLDRLVLAVPREATASYLAGDMWRTRGLAQLSELHPQRRAAALTQTLAPGDLDVTLLFTVTPEGCTPSDAAHSFDRLAMIRGNDMLTQLHALLLSRVLADGGPVPPSVGDLVLFDVGSHLRAVMQPLLDWAAHPDTVSFTAERLVTSPGAARDALRVLHQQWTQRFHTRWLGEPTDHEAWTVQAQVTAHLVAVQDSVQHLAALAPDPRGPHRDILALFAGNIFSRRSLEVLLSEADDPTSLTGTQHGDFVGVWFWNAWSQVIEAMDDITLEI